MTDSESPDAAVRNIEIAKLLRLLKPIDGIERLVDLLPRVSRRSVGATEAGHYAGHDEDADGNFGDRVMTHVLDDRIPLVSLLLVSMRYSPQATLDLEFRSGAVHRYFTVPRAIVEGLRAAESKGAYFNRYIKDRFPSHRLV